MGGGLPPARRFVLPAIFVGALFVVVFLRQPDRSTGPHEYLVTGPTMGTTFTVKVVARGGDDTLKERLAGIIRDVLEGVDRAMSTYRTDSEIAAFNRHGTENFDASPELMEVMKEAQRVARLSGGAFDITVGPLVDAWGFGPVGAAEPPSEEALHRLLAVTGFELIEIDLDLGVVRKARAECRADLSAIAKGFAVDRVAAVFDEEGFQNYMVEIGGEVRTRGRNGAGKQWRIGIERPDFDTRAVLSRYPCQTWLSRLPAITATLSSATVFGSLTQSIRAPVIQSPMVWLRCRSFTRAARLPMRWQQPSRCSGRSMDSQWPNSTTSLRSSSFASMTTDSKRCIRMCGRR